ncbi:MAG: S8 family serine peptidase [Bacteroidota bacterium]
MKRYYPFFILLCALAIAVNGQSLQQKQQHKFMLPVNSGSNDYLAGKIIFKVSQAFAGQCSQNSIDIPALNSALAILGVTDLAKKFPRHSPPLKKTDRFGNSLVDLSTIYECTYTKNISIEAAVNTIIATGIVEYAQPHYLAKILDTVPNDPLVPAQYHLGRIDAFPAWDICKGDSNVVIGIVDWGTDIDHPDLVANFKYNYNDPIDGLDNDNDGYIDNYRGWNMGMNNNNPQENIDHGTRVCGIAAATTSNGTGVAGVGFNCRFLPVRIADANNQGSMAYEGVVYAADHGCSVINCSWKSTFYPGAFGQDIMNYASINMDAVVVAAAGNSGSWDDFYPASYDNVLSVAGTTAADTMWSGSSYSYYVDICAPGLNIESTQNGGTYDYAPGTSFASPIVAGVAGIMRSYFPGWSAMQIAEQLKVSAYKIDNIPANLSKADKIGTGRVDMYRALTDTLNPAIIAHNIHYEDANNQVFTKNDTLQISCDFINYLHASSPTTYAVITSDSPYVKLVDSVFSMGQLGHFATANNAAQPFRIRLLPNIPAGYTLGFYIKVIDTAFTGKQFFALNVNDDYVTIDTNNIALTVTSNGMMGYNNGNHMQGVGCTYNNNPSLLYAGGLLLAISATQVSDAVYGFSGGYDNDFFSVDNAAPVVPSVVSDFDVHSRFNDSLAGAAKLGVTVDQYGYAWNSPADSKYIIIEYVIHNTRAIDLQGLYVGLFMDWDIEQGTKNSISFDAVNRMGYTFPYYGGTYAGIQLLSQGTIFHYAFDSDGTNGSLNIDDGFSGYEKYLTLKTNRAEAGVFAPGNDVADMVSTGPFTIAAGDSVTVTYAILAGNHLADLQASAAAANQRYNYSGLSHYTPQSDAPAMSVYPNPASTGTLITVNLPHSAQGNISIVDGFGKVITTVKSGSLNAGAQTFTVNTVDFPAGFYYVRLSADDIQISQKLAVIK